MVRKDKTSNSIEIAKNVIRNIKENGFDSHCFIEQYAHDYEFEYLQDLLYYARAKKIFKTCHSQIALFLSAHQTEIGICKIKMSKKSKSIFGNKVPNEVWRKN